MSSKARDVRVLVGRVGLTRRVNLTNLGLARQHRVQAPALELWLGGGRLGKREHSVLNNCLLIVYTEAVVIVTPRKPAIPFSHNKTPNSRIIIRYSG